MDRPHSEPLTAARIIEDCGPVAMFALDQPTTIHALQQIQWLWPNLEKILFAFMHMFDVVVPKFCIAECISVWNTFEHECEKDVDIFVAKTLDEPLRTSSLSLHSRVAFKHSPATDLKSYVKAGAQIRTKQQATTTGALCPEICCVCVLLNQSSRDLRNISIDELKDLWATKNKLLAPNKKRCRGDPVAECEHQDDQVWDQHEPQTSMLPFAGCEHQDDQVWDQCDPHESTLPFAGMESPSTMHPNGGDQDVFL